MSLEKLEADDRLTNDLALRHRSECGPLPGDLELLTERITSELERSDPETDLAEAIGRAWMMGARAVLNVAQGRRTCRLCGCWELEACEGGCGWAGADICTACAPNGDPDDAPEACIACDVALNEGDPVYPDIGGGYLHAACCGPEREGYVNMETGEPIGPGEPIPQPLKWSVHGETADVG